ncbi:MULTISPECIES: helix-turn-helix domain-containing protein [unclassified Minwuia]|jgi:DNA-binding transcriptional MerR regulator|uniref:MerR family transcriptional regulator n=1 Tax=unclassified Minwuia TaxID=2618799 RepID=UPI00247A5BAD|nr:MULTISPECIES: helix-turn-helix domain-containing protein [unclassified Minwuia]
MLGIGQLSAETGTKVPTIRYYEDIGLLPEPERTVGNQRRYGQQQVDRLRFIRHCRDMGFPLADVRALLDLSDDPERSCASADTIARHQLQEVERRLASLASLRQELCRMIDQCAGGTVADCRVIESLADHAHCIADRHTTPAPTEQHVEPTRRDPA